VIVIDKCDCINFLISLSTEKVLAERVYFIFD
jgi:hypothetical protein